MAISASTKVSMRDLMRRWDWVLVVALAPILLFPSAGRAWMLLAVPVVLGVQWWAWGAVLPITALNPAILLVAGMTGASIFITPDVEESLPKIAGVVLGMMVYYTVARHAKSLQGWRGALGMLAVAGMGVAMVGLAGTRWFTTKLTGLNAVTAKLPVRLSGLAGAESGIHPNELAGALLWVVPVVALGMVALVVEPKWLASRSGRGKVQGKGALGWGVLLGAASLVSAGVLVLAQSRGGYLAIGLTGVVLAILLARGWARWLVVGLVGVGVVAVLILVSQVGMQEVANMAVDRLPVGDAALSLGTLNGRVEIWSRAVWAIQDVPLTGMGMNVFRRAIFLLYPTFQVSADYNLGHAHNELLQAALDLGLPGLVGFLALYVGALGMLVPVMRGGGALRLLGLGVMGGLLAHFVYGMTDAVALGAKPGFLLWWLLGMAYGLYEVRRPSRGVAG